MECRSVYRLNPDSTRQGRHRQPISGMAVKGESIFGSSVECGVYQWHVGSGDKVRVYETDGAPSALCLHLKAPVLFIGHKGGRIRKWRLSQEEWQPGSDWGGPVTDRELVGHSKEVTALECCSSRELLISGSRDASLKVWRVETGECVASLVGHLGAVRAIALSADNRILSGSADATVKQWAEQESGEWGLVRTIKPVSYTHLTLPTKRIV
eukprot:TRINITY_DN20279_c0_g1_i1.p2 TRINITY_DN20279_c0_g1~~TRINITY_DN20279_c0_g1_i1.p2  ORF type:complete len:211 (-),score=30.83 TRINITY_DN20279_c0_g1_i1:123-755(-)